MCDLPPSNRGRASSFVTGVDVSWLMRRERRETVVAACSSGIANVVRCGCPIMQQLFAVGGPVRGAESGRRGVTGSQEDLWFPWAQDAIDSGKVYIAITPVDVLAWGLMVGSVVASGFRAFARVRSKPAFRYSPA